MRMVCPSPAVFKAESSEKQANAKRSVRRTRRQQLPGGRLEPAMATRGMWRSDGGGYGVDGGLREDMRRKCPSPLRRGNK